MFIVIFQTLYQRSILSSTRFGLRVHVVYLHGILPSLYKFIHQKRKNGCQDVLTAPCIIISELLKHLGILLRDSHCAWLMLEKKIKFSQLFPYISKARVSNSVHLFSFQSYHRVL